MDLAIALDSYLPKPLHQQIYEELRRAILTGRLLPGQKIPSTRALAKSLGLSRTTVTQSYEQLLSEGYLQTIIGSGTYICAQLPDDLLHSVPVVTDAKKNTSRIKFSRQGARLTKTLFSLQTEINVTINFRYGRPALKDFPQKLWSKLLSRHCKMDLDWLDYTTDFQGYLPLRVAIAHYLARARAIQCDSKQIIITNGTQQALDLVMRLFIDPGDSIVIEDPGYLSARRVFLSHGVNLVPVPVDTSGLMVEKLANIDGERIRMVYVTPSHQFPTGFTLSLPRRLELLGWAQQHNALILENDYDSEYRYGERPVPALQGLDQNACVVYTGTFSKVLFPSLRIGYLVVPPDLVSLFAQVKWLSDRQLPTLEQKVLAEFIADGYLESHIRKMRSLYEQRRQVLVEALNTHFGEQVTIFGENAGIHIMVKFHTHLNDETIIERAETVGVGLMSAHSTYLNSYHQGEFILGYAELDKIQIQEGVNRLAKALN